MANVGGELRALAGHLGKWVSSLAMQDEYQEELPGFRLEVFASEEAIAELQRYVKASNVLPDLELHCTAAADSRCVVEAFVTQAELTAFRRKRFADFVPTPTRRSGKGGYRAGVSRSHSSPAAQLVPRDHRVASVSIPVPVQFLNALIRKWETPGSMPTHSYSSVPIASRALTDARSPPQGRNAAVAPATPSSRLKRLPRARRGELASGAAAEAAASLGEPLAHIEKTPSPNRARPAAADYTQSSAVKLASQGRLAASTGGMADGQLLPADSQLHDANAVAASDLPAVGPQMVRQPAALAIQGALAPTTSSVGRKSSSAMKLFPSPEPPAKRARQSGVSSRSPATRGSQFFGLDPAASAGASTSEAATHANQPSSAESAATSGMPMMGAEQLVNEPSGVDPTEASRNSTCENKTPAIELPNADQTALSEDPVLKAPTSPLSTHAAYDSLGRPASSVAALSPASPKVESAAPRPLAASPASAPAAPWYGRIQQIQTKAAPHVGPALSLDEWRREVQSFIDARRSRLSGSLSVTDDDAKRIRAAFGQDGDAALQRELTRLFGTVLGSGSFGSPRWADDFRKHLDRLLKRRLLR